MNQTDSGWRKRQIALDKKSENARELGLDYEPDKTIIELARQAGWQYAHGESGFEPLWAFAKLVREYERDQVTQLLYKMHERAATQHNYYKHAAIEINRKAQA
jgi:hypothetical protein